MTDQEKTDMERLAKAVTALPVEKQFYVLGYAEGVADTMQRSEEDERDRREQE